MYITHSPKRITLKGYKRDDCTINAIGNSLGLSYDLSRKILQVGISINNRFSFFVRSPRTKIEFTEQSNVEMICKSLSVKVERFETSNHKKRTSLAEFAQENNEGIYIALVDSHLVSVIDGKIVDTWDSRDRKMLFSYKIDVTKAHDKIYELAKFYKMTSNEHFIKEHKRKILEHSSI